MVRSELRLELYAYGIIAKKEPFYPQVAMQAIVTSILVKQQHWAIDIKGGDVYRLYLENTRRSIMQAYCMKCRAKREMKDAKAMTMKNGKPATQGTCPVCQEIESVENINY